MNTVTSTTQNRIFITLFITQALFRASDIAAFTLTPIIAVALSGSETMLGYPGTFNLLGRAIFAYPAGLLLDRIGRRLGLSSGYILGLTGGMLGVWATTAGSFSGFVLGAMLLGMMRGMVEQGRFIAAEVYPESQRPRIIGAIVFCGTLGAIGGPLLVDPSTHWATQLGLLNYAGPFLAVIGMQSLAILMTMIFLRPDPLLISHQLSSAEQTASEQAPSQKTASDESPKRPLSEIFNDPLVRLGVAAMVMSQLVMLLLMVVTPLNMDHHHHTTKSISWIIMTHTLGMFGLSGLTGILVERLGRVKMIVIGIAVLLIACALAPISPNLIIVGTALFLLGLGWNFCFVAGSTLLIEGIQPAERGRAQGASESLVAIASGLGSLTVGSLFAWGGMAVLSVIGAALSVVLLAYTGYCVRQARP